MNDRLLNNPAPPREINPHITPEMQEIIYRALEREDKRYKNAEQFMWDLQHEDEVGSPERNERVDGKKRKFPWLYCRRVAGSAAVLPLLLRPLGWHDRRDAVTIRVNVVVFHLPKVRSKPRLWSDKQLTAPIVDRNLYVTFLLNFFDELRRRTAQPK